MRAYVELMKQPGAWRLLLSSLLPRISYGMSGLALFFHVEQLTHSLAAAGYTVGAYSLVSAITAAIRGHAVDRWGQTKPLVLLVPSFAVACAGEAFLASDAPTAIGLAGLMGLMAPPINMSIRPLWKQLAGPDRLRTAYALDSTMLNATGLIGPVVGTAAALNVSGQFAVAMTGALMLVGGVWLLTSPVSRRWRPEAKVEGEAGIFKSVAMRVLALEAVFIGLGYGMFDVAIPSAATLAGMQQWAAPSLSAVALGGLIGGIWAGARYRGVTPGRGLVMTQGLFAVASTPLFLVSPGIQTVIIAFVAGFPLGMAQVFYIEVVDIVRPRGTAVAAMASIWFIEGSAGAAGNAIAGFSAERITVEAAMIAVSVLFLLSALVLYVAARGPLKLAMEQTTADNVG